MFIEIPISILFLCRKKYRNGNDVSAYNGYTPSHPQEMEKSMVVFEKYIPKYFKGALRFYHELMRDTNNQGRNRNIFRPARIPQYIVNRIMPNFSFEIDFYSFWRHFFNFRALLNAKNIFFELQNW